MSIEKVIASIATQHGGPREQRAKHESFVAWQLRERAKADGREPSPILKTFEPASEYEVRFGIPL